MKLKLNQLGKVFAFVFLAVCLKNAQGHPQCLDYKPPYNSSTSDPFPICSEYQDFGCCDSNMVQDILIEYEQLRTQNINDGNIECDKYLRSFICQVCSPYAAHLYNAEGSVTEATTFPGLCSDYCHQFLSEKCGWVVSLITDDQDLIALTESGDQDAFCEAVRPPDYDYCYPDLITNPYLSTDLGSVEFFNKNSSCSVFCVQEKAIDLYNALTLKHAKDGSHRIFVGEQRGIVYVYDHEFNQFEEPFLNITDSVVTNTYRYDERGFLDIEFHPDHKNNGKFYVYYSYTDGAGTQAVNINEMKVMEDDRNRADLSTERQLVVIVQPQANHNGGQLLFGDDGYLYMFTGDGGAKGDVHGPGWPEQGNGQSTDTLLGKVLRIDVDNRTDDLPYGIPPDNPFVDDKSYRPEIYALGVRNMWRCSKDRGDENGVGKGRIICGDVGQDKYEEVDVIEKGANYGWRAFEAEYCYDETMCQNDTDKYTWPIYSYNHTIGKSVTGGYVYRGCNSPNLKGTYIFADYFYGSMFSLKETVNNTWEQKDMCLGDDTVCVNDGLLSSYSKYILSFGEDEAGELYFLSTTRAQPAWLGGSVYKIVDPSARGSPEECKIEIDDGGDGAYTNNFQLWAILLSFTLTFLLK